jgi:enoyl-CoA hydratase/carnithine racemase
VSNASGPRVLVQDDGAVRTLSLSNPQKRNALTRGLLDALVRELPSEAPSPSQPIRAVILRGDPVGRAFSSGFDITAIDAEEAARIGLVDEVVGEGRAHERAAELARAMAGNAPLSVVGMLDAIRRLSRPGGPDADDLMAVEAIRQRALASDDLQEGVRAFVEKRPPRFQGR